MDPNFIKQVLESQAPMPKERTYTIKDVLEDNGELRDGVAAIIKNSAEQRLGEVVTVRVVSRGDQDEVCRVQDINLDTNAQKHLRNVEGAADEQYETWSYNWEFPKPGVDTSNALDKITLTKTKDIVTVEPCRSRLDQPESTVYFLKLLVHIIKTSGSTGQYVYILPYVCIRPSPTNVTLAVKKGKMENLHETMQWICLTFRPPLSHPCFSCSMEYKAQKLFSLERLSALISPHSRRCCQVLFGNAVIACGQWIDGASHRPFFMDMAFDDMKARTKCQTLKEISGGILLEGPNAMLVPIKYTPDQRGIIWCFEEGNERTNRVLRHTRDPTEWLGPSFKQSTLQFEELVGERRALVYTGTDIPSLGSAYSLLNIAQN